MAYGKMRAFDFDHTIYDGYSYRDFVFFTTARRPWVLLWLPVIAVVLLLKICRIIKMKHVVEWVLWPYLRFKRIDEFIVKFWDRNEKKIGQWYNRGGKLERFRMVFGEDAELDEYYTDTPKDSTMLEHAKVGYLVKKGKITRIR